MALTKTTKIIIGGVAAGLLLIAAVAVIVVLSYSSDKNIKLEFQPQNEGNSLIWYNANDIGKVVKWTRILDDFLQEYRESQAENRVACSPASHNLQAQHVCDVPLKYLRPCIKENMYNYDEAGPCVFIKLNKVLDWTPDLYNTSESLPDKMPHELKRYISQLRKEDLNMVWVSCEGENPADVENIGPIQYLPSRGFPAYYYPFTNVEGYLSPLVAVLFEKPNTGVVIRVECRAWAKNIIYNQEKHVGSVIFELLVDSD